ncbi:hypothetical protein [Nostocoides australiense]|nr:hypothetical protein [Tetrasphaera sp.]HPF80357.1 hypothetical protein [Tetrasphaera australiensis]
MTSEDPGIPEKVGSIANDILGGGANWDLIKKTFIGLALAGLAGLAFTVMRPKGR